MTKKPGKGVPLRRASQKLVIALVLAVFIAGAASAQWGGWWGGSSGGGGWWSNQNYGRAQPRQRRRAVQQQYAPQPTYQPQQQYNPFYPSAKQPTAQYPRASTPSRKRARRTPPVMAYAPPDDRETRRSRSPSARAGIRIRRSSRGENPRDPSPYYYSGIKYCVRLCDGRFFELSDPGRMKPEEMCSALCPASDTKVFRGSPIEEATAADGSRYEKLKNAFLYRQKLVANCTCNGKTAYGLAKIDIKSDPTLQAGDIVVMADGLSVYSGTRGRRRNSAARFTPLRKSSLISQSFRRTLNRIEIAKTRPKVQAHQDEPDAPDLTD